MTSFTFLKNNNSQKLFAGLIALVLVAGMTSPVFAQEIRTPPAFEAGPLTLPEPPENTVYQNGNTPQGSGLYIDNKIVADDFVLETSTELTDAHFVWIGDGTGSNIEPLLYYILADNDGQPGSLIASGVAQNVETFELSSNHFETWFDFQTGVPLDNDVTYWFALKYTEDFDIIFPEPNWDITDVITGNPAYASFSPIESADWGGLSFDMFFQLTDSPLDKPIGGTVGSLDTATLLVAGAQANMGLWSLALVGIVGAGVAIIYKTKSKKTEQ